MKRILFSAMPMDDGKSGISNYIFNTLGEMLNGNEISVLVLRKDMPLLEKRFPEAKFLVVSDIYSRPLQNMLWHLFIMPFTIDVSKFDFLFLPAANRRLLSCSRIFSVGTVHDFSQLHVKAKYDAFRMFYIRNCVPFFLRRLDAIVSVSESTRKDLVGYCRIESKRISVIYNGYDASRYNVKFASDPGSTRAKFAGGMKYILYISRIEHPGKNHVNLMTAYEMLPPSLTDEYALVMAGSDWSGAEKVHSYAEKSRMKEKFFFPGFVGADELPHLYRGASLYVFPSFFEGFGIPLVEAMACGLPCACSNSSSLAEIAGDAALTFDPHCVSDIAEKIEMTLGDSILSLKLSEKGLDRISIFSWEKHVKGILDIYERGKEKK